MHGSVTLAQTLIERNLVDQYNLLVYPRVLGEGKPLFKQGSRANLRLAETRAFDSGAVLLRYQPDREE